MPKNVEINNGSDDGSMRFNLEVGGRRVELTVGPRAGQEEDAGGAREGRNRAIRSGDQERRILPSGSIDLLFPLTRKLSDDEGGSGEHEFFVPIAENAPTRGNESIEEGYIRACSDLIANKWTPEEVAELILAKVPQARTRSRRDSVLMEAKGRLVGILRGLFAEARKQKLGKN